MRTMSGALLQIENSFEANLKVLTEKSWAFWIIQCYVLGSAEASVAFLLEGRAISARRGKSENCCSYQQSCQINCSAECELIFARRSHQYLIEIMLRFYLMGQSVCKLMPKVVLLKTCWINGNSCKNHFDWGTHSLSGMSALIVIPLNICHWKLSTSMKSSCVELLVCRRPAVLVCGPTLTSTLWTRAVQVPKKGW